MQEKRRISKSSISTLYKFNTHTITNEHEIDIQIEIQNTIKITKTKNNEYVWVLNVGITRNCVRTKPENEIV